MVLVFVFQNHFFQRLNTTYLVFREATAFVTYAIIYIIMVCLWFIGKHTFAAANTFALSSFL